MNWIFVGASTIASQYMVGAVRARHNVTWIVSNSAKHVGIWAHKNSIKNATTQLDDALADHTTSVVYISSTNEKHFGQAMAAIAAGKHVLCEKPLAMTSGEAHEMVTAAHRAGLIFATNHHLRCAGSHWKIRELIATGRVGNILSLRIFHAVHLPHYLRGWRINDASAGGGVIPDITVHDADVARFLLGEDPIDVVAMSGETGMGKGVEDSAMSLWAMPSGAMVMSHESFTHPFAGSGLEVHGDQGSIFARGVMTQEPKGEIELVTKAGREPVSFSTHSLYEQGVADFVDAIKAQETGQNKRQGRPAADGIDGIKSLAVAQAVRHAAQSGTRVIVDYGGLA